MRVFLVLCLIASPVFSATLFRDVREVNVAPFVEEILKESIISELKKDEIPVAIESDPIPVEIFKDEETPTPVEATRIVVPVVAVEEPVAVISVKTSENADGEVKTVEVIEKEEIIAPAVLVEEVKLVEPEVVLHDEQVGEPTFVVAEPVVVPEQSVVNEPIQTIVENDTPVVVALEPEFVEKVETAPVESAPVADVVEPFVEVVEEVKEVAEPIEAVRQTEAGSEPVRPTLLQQAQDILTNNPITQFINNNPISQAINNIRVPPTTTPSADGPVLSEGQTNPNILQQLQTNIQTGFTNLFNPNAANSGASEAEPNRPGILQNIQNAVNNVINPPRPADGTASNPIQSVVQTLQSTFIQPVQNLLSGNRNDEKPVVVVEAKPEETPADEPTETKPVDVAAIEEQVIVADPVKDTDKKTEEKVEAENTVEGVVKRD